MELLTHWGRVMYICVSKLTSIGSDNGLSPGRRQAIIRSNAGIALIGPFETNCSEILIEVQTFSLKKIRLKMSSAKCRPFCLSLNVLMPNTVYTLFITMVADVLRPNIFVDIIWINLHRIQHTHHFFVSFFGRRLHKKILNLPPSISVGKTAIQHLMLWCLVEKW